MDCKNKSDISKNKGNWKHVKIFQKLPDKPAEQARNQGTGGNCPIAQMLRKVLCECTKPYHGK